jgi:ATP-dependent Clp endopeptidase proteolytic subunit ClpP
VKEEDGDSTDPRIVEARVRYYNAQTDLAKQQERKERFIADQHEISAQESAKLFRETSSTNINNRVYDFAEIVHSETTEKAIQTLSRWARQSIDPITLRISSPGGSVIDGLKFYDFLLGLRNSGIEVRTVVLGIAASMACILLQAGTRRVVGPNSRILIHEIQAEHEGKLSLSEMEDQTKLFEIINKNLYSILAERSKVPAREIETKAKRRDWWLAADEVVNKGFADEIGYK